MLVAAAVIASAWAAWAQQPGAPSSTITGTWQLDPYVSDHPEMVARILQLSTGAATVRPREELRGRGGFGRLGDRPRERSGGTKGDQAAEPPRDALNDQDRRVLDELTGGIRFAPARLTIARNGAAVTISGDAREPLTLATDAKAEKQTIADATIERRATWEGPQLLVTYDVGKAGTLSLRYERAPTTGQLVVRASFARRLAEASPLEVKLVYDPAPR
jgi:hypothetical protein